MNKKPNTSGLKPPMTSENQPAKRGRPQGSKNSNNLVRNYIQENYKGGVDGYIQHLLDVINEIKNPTEKGKLLTQLLNYIAPQLKSVDHTIALDPSSGRLTIVYKTATLPAPSKGDVEVK